MPSAMRTHRALLSVLLVALTGCGTPTADVSLAWMTVIDAEAPTAKARLHIRGRPE
jgi:hypothetical protein